MSNFSKTFGATSGIVLAIVVGLFICILFLCAACMLPQVIDQLFNGLVKSLPTPTP